MIALQPQNADHGVNAQSPLCHITGVMLAVEHKLNAMLLRGLSKKNTLRIRGPSHLQHQ
jgi:hypothetical protein